MSSSSPSSSAPGHVRVVLVLMLLLVPSLCVRDTRKVKRHSHSDASKLSVTDATSWPSVPGGGDDAQRTCRVLLERTDRAGKGVPVPDDLERMDKKSAEYLKGRQMLVSALAKEAEYLLTVDRSAEGLQVAGDVAGARACLAVALKVNPKDWLVHYMTARMLGVQAAQAKDAYADSSEVDVSLVHEAADRHYKRAGSVLRKQIKKLRDKYLVDDDEEDPPQIAAQVKMLRLVHSSWAETKVAQGDKAYAVKLLKHKDIKSAMMLADLNTLGLLQSDLGYHRAAVNSFQRAIKFKDNPNLPAVYNNFGLVLTRGGNKEAALEAYKQAMQRDPSSIQYRLNFGSMLVELEQWDRARHAYKSLLNKDPANEVALNMISKLDAKLDDVTTLKSGKQMAKSLDLFLTKHGNDAGAGAWERWLSLARSVANEQIGSEGLTKALDTIDRVYTAAREFCGDDAAKWDQLSEELRAAFFYRLHLRAYSSNYTDWEREIEHAHHYANEISVKALDGEAPSITPMRALTLLDNHSLRKVLKGHIAAFQKYAEFHVELKHQPPVLTHDPIKISDAPHVVANRPLRVAFVSEDLIRRGSHPMKHLWPSATSKEPMFSEVIRPFKFNIARRNAELMEGDYEVVHSLTEQIHTVMNLQLDAVVDLSGFSGTGDSARLMTTIENVFHDAKDRPLVFSYLGWPATFGDKIVMQYLIADAVAAPVEFEKRGDYTEKIVRLPSFLVGAQHRDVYHSVLPSTARPTEDEPVPELTWEQRRELRETFGLPTDEDVFVYANFNQLHKNGPDVLDAWASILQQVPKSVLWLLALPEEGRTNIEHELRERGVDVDNRLFWSPFEGNKHKYMRRSAAADLFIDQWRYSAGSTAVDMAWVGVPVLAYLGNRTVARMSGSVNAAMGVGELLNVENADDYVRLAVELGSNGPVEQHETLREARRILHEARWSSSNYVFDYKAWSSALETAITRAVRWERRSEYTRSFEILPGEGPPTFTIEVEDDGHDEL